MRTKKVRHWMVMAVGVAAMLTQTGCATKRRTAIGAGAFDDVPFTEGDILTGDTLRTDTLGMSGERFESLPKVQGAAFSPVYFAYDNYQIIPSEFGKIDAVAGFLRANANVVLVVEGHCDERGSHEYNMSLGEHRAQSIRAYLIDTGIAPERVQTASYGEERPAAQGTGESVWRLNRRGEFALYQR